MTEHTNYIAAKPCNRRRGAEPTIDYISYKLTQAGWIQSLATNTNVSFHLPYRQLEEISFNIDSDNHIHVNVPLYNSDYSYYKPFQSIESAVKYIDSYLTHYKSYY